MQKVDWKNFFLPQMKQKFASDCRWAESKGLNLADIFYCVGPIRGPTQKAKLQKHSKYF